MHNAKKTVNKYRLRKGFLVLRKEIISKYLKKEKLATNNQQQPANEQPKATN